MYQYHKIQTVFHRDPDNRFKTLLEGKYSLPEFEYLKDNKWVFTEKVDGTNIRLMLNEIGQYKIRGKSDNAQIPPFLLDVLTEIMVSREDTFKDIFKDTAVCMYGEGYGAKIQKGGGNYRQDQDFVLFDVKIGDWWLQRKDVEDIANILDLDVIPIIGSGTLNDMLEMTKKGFVSQWGDFKAEGIVARPQTELIGRNGKRIITKIKQKDFKQFTKNKS